MANIGGKSSDAENIIIEIITLFKECPVIIAIFKKIG